VKTKRVRVEVTAEDIARGRSCANGSCPIARAARRVLGCPVSVGSCSIAGKGKGWVTSLPRKARDFIRAFDDIDGALRPVKPFAFTLRIPETPATGGMKP
jgi:hypothetical protein